MARLSMEDVRDAIRSKLREDKDKYILPVERSILVWTEYWIDVLINQKEEEYATYPAKIDCVTCPMKEECDKRFDAALAGKTSWSCRNDNKSDEDDIINQVIRACYHVADSLTVYKRLIALPDCNTCAEKDMCRFVPEPGGQTRINCPHWKDGRNE